ncbi:hypothetical protein Taro_056058 [Colocasia esculenta]|uniref:Uncharacterized protein n=1 Tax=Colocasia esculenta TaxID=4460 RepID=A0A843XW68_COLES|nr:hypothetical protein [Colocasia esculenta]
MFLRGDSAQVEILLENIFIYSQIRNSAQVEIPSKNISIKLKFVPIHMCFLKGSSAHVKVFFLKNISMKSQTLYSYTWVFKRKLCPNRVSARRHVYIIINSQLYMRMPLKRDSVHADDTFCRILHSNGDIDEKICVNCRFMFIHTCFLESKFPPGKGSLRTHGYKYIFI